MKSASPLSELGASVVHRLLADRSMPPPLRGRGVVHKNAMETRNPTSLVIIEMTECNAVQLFCRYLWKLPPVDTLDTLEEESGINQNSGERRTTMSQKKKPLGSASSKISESRRTARGCLGRNHKLRFQSRQSQEIIFSNGRGPDERHRNQGKPTFKHDRNRTNNLESGRKCAEMPHVKAGRCQRTPPVLHSIATPVSGPGALR